MVIDESLREAFSTFLSEATDLLHDLEEGLLDLEDDPAALNAVFRAVHTLKGSAGLFGLDHLVQFTHDLETVLDALRTGQLPVTRDLISTLLPCADHLTTLITHLHTGTLDPTDEDQGTTRDLLTTLRPYLTPADTAGTSTTDAGTGTDAGGGGERRCWQITVRFGPDCLRNGMDPLAFLRYLSTLGEMGPAEINQDELPALHSLDPETCYLGFQTRLRTTASKTDIEDVFDFVRDDSDIRILPADQDLDTYIARIHAMPPSDRIGEVLVRAGVLTHDEVTTATRLQQEHPTTPLGEILIAHGLIQRPLVDAALRKQRRTSDARTTDTHTIRIDATRLDRLIDLVGELVIAQAAATTHTTTSGALLEAHREVTRLVEEVRHSALSLRMVPIGTTLRRFDRIVRDTAGALDKTVDLVITGGDSEMDKALVERISDPLLHLVRNALDHGIEPRPERVTAGKPAHGTIRLHAYHDAGCIVIEVSDDGRGLDRDRIRTTAIHRGLTQSDATLTDQDLYDLIFEPGFSTAASVSDLSGRGVGMDVVRRNVTALRGSIDVHSAPARGTTFRIRLPLTLAIIDGFLVNVGTNSYVIPLDRVTECVELPPIAHTHDHINLRGDVLPLIRLRTLFHTPQPPNRRQNVVIIEDNSQRTGLVVDTLQGQLQTVIKPLGSLFHAATCISGATILGNGNIALILDVAALVTHHTNHQPVPTTVRSGVESS